MENRIFYEFDDFRLNRAKRLLERVSSGEVVPLTPKVFDTLLVLIESGGRVVEKDELMCAVWPDTIVEENNLTQNISMIRKTLGERRNEHRFVVTVSGRGYRFVADVREVTTAPAAPSATIKNFTETSAAQLNEECTSNEVNKTVHPVNDSAPVFVHPIESRKTINKQSLLLVALVILTCGLLITFAARQRNVSEATKPAMIVAANARNSNQNQGFAQSLETSNEESSHDPETASVRKLATSNAEAHNAYLKGRYFWDKRTRASFKKAIEYFQKAVALDPDYALAYAGLADCYVRLNETGMPPSKNAVPQATRAVTKALELNDVIAEAHATLGFIKFRYEWDFAAAEREFKRALELNPHYASAHQWYAFYLLAMKRMAEADAEMKQSLELEPLSLGVNLNVGIYLYFTRRYTEAIEQLQRTLEMDASFTTAQVMLALACEQNGQSDEAIVKLRKARDSETFDVDVSTALAHAYSTRGSEIEARRTLKDLQNRAHQQGRYVSPYQLALLHTALHDPNAALDALDKAYGEGSLKPAWLLYDPRLDSLRALQQFQDLVRRIGLSA